MKRGRVDELCRRQGVSPATFYAWRKKFDGMEASISAVFFGVSITKKRCHETWLLLQDLGRMQRGPGAENSCYPGRSGLRRSDPAGLVRPKSKWIHHSPVRAVPWSSDESGDADFNPWLSPAAGDSTELGLAAAHFCVCPLKRERG